MATTGQHVVQPWSTFWGHPNTWPLFYWGIGANWGDRCFRTYLLTKLSNTSERDSPLEALITIFWVANFTILQNRLSYSKTPTNSFEQDTAWLTMSSIKGDSRNNDISPKHINALARFSTDTLGDLFKTNHESEVLLQNTATITVPYKLLGIVSLVGMFSNEPIEIVCGCTNSLP